MQKQNISNSSSKQPIRRQTVFGRSTYNYALITSVKAKEDVRPDASRLNLPLETDGPATCLVFYSSSYK